MYVPDADRIRGTDQIKIFMHGPISLRGVGVEKPRPLALNMANGSSYLMIRLDTPNKKKATRKTWLKMSWA